MISDEEQVRTLLRESVVPPTRLDPHLLLDRGRRSRRRWRLATAAGAVLAVVAVTVPAMTVADRLDRHPDRVAGDSRFSTTTRVVHRDPTISATLRCDPTPLPAPAGPPATDTVTAADPTGTHVIGGATLWTRGVSTLITVPGARSAVTAAAVNSSGTVVGHDGNETGLNWRFTDGAVRELARPAGYRLAVALHVNDRGDTLGLASGPVDLNGEETALVLWPADRPDRPRIIRESGSQPLAVRDDGTVIAARNRSEVDLGAGAIVVHRPDGRRLEIQVPRELTNPGSMLNATVHGDYLYSSYANAEITYSDGVTTVAPPFLDPVRWNLRTGLIEIFDRFRDAPVGGPDGWFVAAEDPDGAAADKRFALVGPDRTTHRFPVADATVRAVAGPGTMLAGSTPTGSVSWYCAP